MSNLGRWDGWHRDTTTPAPYGDVRSYQVGAAFLSDCALVEDWGCGMGWMRQYVQGDYRGIDGSISHFSDATVDLCTYSSDVDGVFMRHVLEHNYDWRSILGNALASARRRCVIILFTPLADAETQIGWNENIGVPDLSLPWPELERIFSTWTYTSWTTPSNTQCCEETIVLISKPGVEHEAAAKYAKDYWDMRPSPGEAP